MNNKPIQTIFDDEYLKDKKELYTKSVATGAIGLLGMSAICNGFPIMNTELVVLGCGAVYAAYHRFNKEFSRTSKIADIVKKHVGFCESHDLTSERDKSIFHASIDGILLSSGVKSIIDEASPNGEGFYILGLLLLGVAIKRIHRNFKNSKKMSALEQKLSQEIANKNQNDRN